MAVITLPTNGLEITPRLWLGGNVTCDSARQDLSYTCINVGATSHTSDPRCHFIPLCTATGGFVSSGQLAKIQNLILNAMSNVNQKALLHCALGLATSPLATALWLQLRYQITIQEAYQWVLAKQPQAQILTNLLPPKLP